MPPSETGPTHFSNWRLLMCMVTAPLSKRVTRNMQANFLFFAAVSGVCDFFIYEEARGQQRRSEIRPKPYRRPRTGLLAVARNTHRLADHLVVFHPIPTVDNHVAIQPERHLLAPPRAESAHQAP